MIRVIVVDDHTLFVEGLRAGLEAMPDINVTSTLTSGAELLTALESLETDVVIMDLEMPGASGLDTLAEMPDAIPCLIVTMHATEDNRTRAAELGAAGLLSKSTPLEDLTAAVRAVHRGERLHDPTTTREILDLHRTPELDPAAASLTLRERELLEFLAAGISSTPELSERLFISQKTVKNHLASIYEKLGVADRAQAAVEAIRLGIS